MFFFISNYETFYSIFYPFPNWICSGLFVKHTKTGNPLVDSVAEHQPASPQAYYQYLHYLCYVAPVGFS